MAGDALLFVHSCLSGSVSSPKHRDNFLPESEQHSIVQIEEDYRGMATLYFSKGK